MFKFLEVDDFLYDLQTELYSDLDEIIFIYFKISYKNYFKKIYPLLLMQLDLGTKVSLYLDGIFSKESFNGFRLHFCKKNKNNIQELHLRNKAFDNLVKKGAHLIFFNEPKNFIQKYFFTFTGRDHRKFIYIKRKNGISLSYFGATNLDKSKSFDYMIKSLNSALNDKLLEINLQICQKKTNQNIMLNLKDFGFEGNIMIDSGLRYSLIYDNALNLIEKSKQNIIFVSQLPPEPHILFYLCKAALRGVNINILIADPKIYNFIIRLAYYFAKLISLFFKFNIRFVKTGYTHAKVLICDNDFILGSHNLSFVGVISGTIEMSIQSNEISLLKDVLKFIKKL